MFEHSLASAVRDALHEAKLDPKEMAEERPNKADINQVLDALAEVKPGDGENHTLDNMAVREALREKIQQSLKELRDNTKLLSIYNQAHQLRPATITKTIKDVLGKQASQMDKEE